MAVAHFVDSQRGTPGREVLTKLVIEGRIEIAPKWVGTYQSLPRGEALVRNPAGGESPLFLPAQNLRSGEFSNSFEPGDSGGSPDPLRDVEEPGNAERRNLLVGACISSQPLAVQKVRRCSIDRVVR